MIYDLSKDIDKKRAKTYVERLMNQSKVCEIKMVTEKRSLNQNSYLHACFGYIAKETGYNIEEAKIVMKEEFGSFMIYVKNDRKFTRSTSDLDTNEMTQFIDWLRLFSSEQLGIYLMTPEEYYKYWTTVYQDLEGVI